MQSHLEVTVTLILEDLLAQLNTSCGYANKQSQKQSGKKLMLILLQKGQFWNDTKIELTNLDRYKVTVHVSHIHIPSSTSNCTYYTTSFYLLATVPSLCLPKKSRIWLLKSSCYKNLHPLTTNWGNKVSEYREIHTAHTYPMLCHTVRSAWKVYL